MDSTFIDKIILLNSNTPSHIKSLADEPSMAGARQQWLWPPRSGDRLSQLLAVAQGGLQKGWLSGEK